MLRAATILLCLTVSSAAGAQVFKCTHNGKVTYSESPCPGARVTQLEVPPPAPAAAPQPAPEAELQRQKALADQLGAERRQREAQHERVRARMLRDAAQRHQRCEKLRLQKKWADDDARNARDSDQSRILRRKADRAAEALKVECPG
ncbi:DUF4124 domain-containing protein [Pseudoduganella sp. GCM10020061]|uniref:DUF4124 domain-containing protein n=1 Tax=Pseudoduganella sp. GCM10020061 TaxID=3317345 RepID=UPI00364276FD